MTLLRVILLILTIGFFTRTPLAQDLKDYQQKISIRVNNITGFTYAFNLKTEIDYLIYLSATGKNEELRLLLSSMYYRAKKATQKKGWTEDMVLEANVNIKIQNDWTPLMFASANGHEAVVKTLLQIGADPHSMATGGTALIFAAANGHHHIVKALLKKVHIASDEVNLLSCMPVPMAMHLLLKHF